VSLAFDPGEAVQILHVLVPQDVHQGQRRDHAEKMTAMVDNGNQGQSMMQRQGCQFLLILVYPHHGQWMKRVS